MVVVCAWFTGGFISGVSGIGGAMFAVPIAAMFIPIQQVIVLSCILNLAMDGMLEKFFLRKWGTVSLNQGSVEMGDSPVKNWMGSCADFGIKRRCENRC